MVVVVLVVLLLFAACLLLVVVLVVGGVGTVFVVAVLLFSHETVGQSIGVGLVGQYKVD